MGDPETREVVINLLKNDCPVVLQGKGPLGCKFSRSREDCRLCTYPWTPLVRRLLKTLEHRRASVKLERKKARAVKKKLEEITSTLTDLLASITENEKGDTDGRPAVQSGSEKVSAGGQGASDGGGL